MTEFAVPRGPVLCAYWEKARFSMIFGQWLITGAAGLVVATGTIGTAENLAMGLTDRQITDQVIQQIAVDDPTAATAVLVTTRNRVVTLSGGRLTPGDILAVTHAASDAHGVRGVDSHLTLT
jgi:osmotically-inducible protein OsmY